MKLSLEETLARLSAYGNPSLLRLSGSRWHCHVDMHVNAIGGEFKIRSDFDHEEPIDAAKECLYRMQEAISVVAKNMRVIG